VSKYDLDKKDVNIDGLAEEALSDEDLFRELMDGILSKDDTIRSNSFKVLTIISENNGEFLYPQWDHFQNMLQSPNNYHKYIAIYLLANLTTVDVDKKFETIFQEYYGILAGDRAMTASHVALNSSKIAQAKPELRSQIIDQLLNIDTIHTGKQKELIKAYAIEALLSIHPEAEDKERIEEFVKSQLDSKSPKTRNMAQCFLERCEN
jgi:hypothetical protein